MRILFFVLVLGNAAFFAWTWFAHASSSESQLLEQQLHPESIRLLTPEQVAKAAKQVAPAPAKPPAQVAAAKPPETEAKPAETVKVAACMELGGFNTAEVAKVEQALGP